MRWHNAGLTGAASPPWRPKGRGLYPAPSAEDRKPPAASQPSTPHDNRAFRGSSGAWGA